MQRLLLFALLAVPAFAGKAKYEYTRIGNSANAVRTTTPGIMLIGGGTDVDAAFQQLCTWGADGDILVIRATGTDAYNPYIASPAVCPSANSVATLVIPNAAGANDPAVANYINDAEAIFIAGGDQSNYINEWTGTGLQSALNAARATKPIGGTSAGMMVLSEFVYSALLSKGVTSSQALADPYSRYLTIARDFMEFPVLAGAISDSHFAARDRMGRNLAFLCRVYAAGLPNPRSIAIDEATALLIPPTGPATVRGVGSVYFLRALVAPDACAAGVPLSYPSVAVYRISGMTASFNLSTWIGSGGTGYNVTATSGVLSSTQAGGAIY